MTDFLKFEDYKVINGQAPAVFRLGRPPHQLVFIAAWHSNDPDHPQIKMIEDAFKEFNPQIVLFESYDWPIEGDPIELIKRYGEPAYAKRLASDAGIPAESAEPGWKEENDAYVKKYGQELIAAFYVFRNVWQYHRQVTKAPTFEAEVRSKFERRFKNLGMTSFKWTDLDRISKQELGTPFDPANYRLYRDACDPTKSGTTFNEIARYTGYVRDRAVVEKIARLKANYPRILIVMGASHYYTIEPYLKELYD